MPRIFISYRRSDSMSYTGRIYDYLINQFGQENVFKDVDDIPIGTNFRNIIISQISQSDVVLVIIGPTWLNTIDSFNTRRLENPNDFVRMEVETALNLKHVKVIPVLIDNALMPNAEDLPHQLQKIAFLNAIMIRHDPDFRRDMQRLITFLQTIKPLKSPRKINRSRLLFISLVTISVISLIGIFIFLNILRLQIIDFTLTQTPTTTPSLTSVSVNFQSTANARATLDTQATLSMRATAIQIVVEITATEAPLNTLTAVAIKTSELINNSTQSPTQLAPTQSISFNTQPELENNYSIWIPIGAIAIVGSTFSIFILWRKQSRQIIPAKVSPKAISTVIPKVFVSYRRDPSAMLANLISDRLQTHQIDTFVDTSRQDGAGLFPDYLYKSIEKRDIFVCLISDTTLYSDWVLREIRHAYELKKPMIPVFQERYKDWAREPKPYFDLIEKLKKEMYPVEGIEMLLKSKGVHVYDRDNIHVSHSIQDLIQMIKETHLEVY